MWKHVGREPNIAVEHITTLRVLASARGMFSLIAQEELETALFELLSPEPHRPYPFARIFCSLLSLLSLLSINGQNPGHSTHPRLAVANSSWVKTLYPW